MRLIFKLGAVTTSLQSCDHDLGFWQLACIYDGCSIHLQPSQLASDKQNQWSPGSGKLKPCNIMLKN